MFSFFGISYAFLFAFFFFSLLLFFDVLSWCLLLSIGEVFGGIHVDRDKNDGETLLDALEKCGDYKDRCVEEGKFSVPDILSSVKGPWALIYWQVLFVPSLS